MLKVNSESFNTEKLLDRSLYILHQGIYNLDFQIVNNNYYQQQWRSPACIKCICFKRGLRPSYLNEHRRYKHLRKQIFIDGYNPYLKIILKNNNLCISLNYLYDNLISLGK